jgi:hypothetical protein
MCSGAALLVEAANMGDSDAQYELGCRLRIEVCAFHAPFSLHSMSYSHIFLLSSGLFFFTFVSVSLFWLLWVSSLPQLAWD